MELLSPAGSLEKLKYAIDFGADSVYAAGKHFGLRAKASNLTDTELKEAVSYCHERGKKLYVPLNIFAHNRDLEHLPAYINFLNSLGVDAIIVSDPGVLKTIKEEAPGIPLHLSTQANTTSWKAAEFWKEQGVERIILARELTFSEVLKIKAKVPDMELEIFIHGAMCISYSGRCLISAFLNNRSANQGLCTHPCRWKYSLYEESRPNQFFPVEEDERGSYILNSKDLCLLGYMHLIVNSGIDSAKIEGRMKSLYYVANTTRIYRTAIDILKKDNTITPETMSTLQSELNKVSHREWTTGFFDGIGLESQCYNSSSYIREYQFLGEIISVEKNNIIPQNRKRRDQNNKGYLININVRAKFSVGEQIEFIFPDIINDKALTIDLILDEENNPIKDTKPNTTVKLLSDEEYPLHGIVRKKKSDL